MRDYDQGEIKDKSKKGIRGRLMGKFRSKIMGEMDRGKVKQK